MPTYVDRLYETVAGDDDGRSRDVQSSLETVEKFDDDAGCRRDVASMSSLLRAPSANCDEA